MAFNHDAQILAIGSDKKKDAFRMVSRGRHGSVLGSPVSSDPSSFRNRILQLADIVDAARHGHRRRLFRRERVCRDRKHERKGLVVWPQALQRDVEYGVVSQVMGQALSMLLISQSRLRSFCVWQWTRIQDVADLLATLRTGGGGWISFGLHHPRARVLSLRHNASPHVNLISLRRVKSDGIPDAFRRIRPIRGQRL